MKLTARQATALANPCATPADTVAERFRSIRQIGELAWISTILTINK